MKQHGPVWEPLAFYTPELGIKVLCSQVMCLCHTTLASTIALSRECSSAQNGSRKISMGQSLQVLSMFSLLQHPMCHLAQLVLLSVVQHLCLAQCSHDCNSGAVATAAKTV